MTTPPKLRCVKSERSKSSKHLPSSPSTFQDTMASVLGTFPIPVRGRQEQREPTVTKRIPSCPRSITNQAMPLGRQIGEHKWWSGVAVLQSTDRIKEILVCTHYSGWRYVLARTKNPNVFVKLTYYNNHLQPIERMLSPWGPTIYDEDETSTQMPAYTLPTSSWLAYTPLVVRCASC